ncbi:MAG: hypothetical protein ACO1TE_05860 [Prosthecobacter sp.]
MNIVGFLAAVVASLWSWLSRCRCPQCMHPMKVAKAPVRSGGVPLLLVCHRCKTFLDTGVMED